MWSGSVQIAPDHTLYQPGPFSIFLHTPIVNDSLSLILSTQLGLERCVRFLTSPYPRITYA